MADLLVIDDDADLAELLAELLDSAGHVCRLAHNGREGLELILERRPELLLLNIEMPVLTGPEMAHWLQVRDCGDEKIPVVLLSGCLELGLIAAQIGTPYYLAKPYTRESVLNILDRALRERVSPCPARVGRELRP